MNASNGVRVVPAGLAVNSTTLEGTYGGLINLLPAGAGAACYDTGPYLPVPCVDVYGRVLSVANGTLVVAAGRPIASPTQTVTGSWGVAADLLPTGVAAGVYGAGVYLTRQYINAYGQTVNATNGAQVVTYGLAVNSTTLAGAYPNLEQAVVNGQPVFPFGQNASCFLAGTVDAYGRVLGPACLSIALSGGGGSGYSIFLGTPNQIVVTVLNNITLQISAVQDIAPGSSPTFFNLALTGLTAHGALYADVGKVLRSAVLGNGQELAGVAGGDPVPGGISSVTISVTNNPGAVVLELPQPLAPTDAPTFVALSLTSFAGGYLLASAGTLVSETAIPTGSVITTATLLGGDLQGMLPNPTLVTVLATPGCFNYLSYTVCSDAQGRTVSITATGNTTVLVGSAVFSATNTITGTYGVTLDLVPTAGTAFAFGQNASCVLAGVVDVYGRVTSPVCSPNVFVTQTTALRPTRRRSRRSCSSSTRILACPSLRRSIGTSRRRAAFTAERRPFRVGPRATCGARPTGQFSLSRHRCCRPWWCCSCSYRCSHVRRR